jgi:replication initiator protein RepSA
VTLTPAHRVFPDGASRPGPPHPSQPDTYVSTTGTAEGAAYWPWAKPGPPPSPHPDARLGFDPAEVRTARERVSSMDYPEWINHVQGAAACKHPIRLTGQIDVKNPDGTLMHSIDTDEMPDGAIYTPCGNRRAAVCPSCAETYRRDTYHLIAAGLRGDRWGLPPLGQHIAVFLTATAPSFGTVHHRVVKTHAADCRAKDTCTCRPAVCHPFGKPCPHGRETRCTARHKASDTVLGQPLCLDCYDHAGQVVWNHEAPELWRRTLEKVKVRLARLGKRLGTELRRPYVKVYEFQARGVIHYHAVIRLDGYHPDCPGAIVPPDRLVTRHMFAELLETAFRETSYTSAGHPTNPGGWRIAWGTHGLDLKHINAPGGDENLAKLTGYLAKYVTKSTEATGQTFRRIDDLTIELHARPDTHIGRLIGACWDLGTADGWHRLRRWAHQFGCGGHITTKSRGFSVTYGFIRGNRTIFRRTDGHPELWDEQQADLVVYRLGYHATGWITTGDALLANSAADAARRRADAARDYADDEPNWDLSLAA